MTLIFTSWHRNLAVWVLVCMCWFGSVAGQEALEQVEDESNEATSEEATASLETNDTAGLRKQPLETLELEQPDKTSGNYHDINTLSVIVHVTCVWPVYVRAEPHS